MQTLATLHGSSRRAHLWLIRYECNQITAYSPAVEYAMKFARTYGVYGGACIHAVDFGDFYSVGANGDGATDTSFATAARAL